jgi:hypothetical protein
MPAFMGALGVKTGHSMDTFIPLHIEAGVGSKLSLGDNYPNRTDSICPVCGTQMEKGRLVGHQWISLVSDIYKSERHAEPMGPHSRPLLYYAYVEAFRCRKCRIPRYEYLDIDSRMVQLKCPYCGAWNEYYKKKSEHDVRICQTCAKEF